MRRARPSGRWAYLGLLLAAGPVFSQTPAIPSQVEPGRESQRDRLPAQRDAVEISVESSSLSPAPPANAETLRFILSQLDIEGATAFPAATLLAPHRNKIGQEISVAQLYQIASDVTRHYREAGYFLTVATVPPQRIESGRAVIRVVEGGISDVELRGAAARGGSAQYSLNDLTHHAAQDLALERKLLLLNDLPDMTARGTLVPSDRGLGYARLIVDTRQQRFRTELEADNRASGYLGNERYTGRVYLNSLFGVGDATILQYQTSSSELFKTWSADHVERLGSNGLSLRLGYVDYRSEPDLGADFSGFNLETNSKSARMELSYPVLRSRRTNLSTRVGLSYHDGVTASDFLTELSRDVITVARAGFTFDRTDGWRGVNMLDIEVSRGIDAFGASRAGDPNLSRLGGRPDGAKATFYLARLQDLRAGFSMLWSVTGQYAMSNLLAPEEFAFGGEYFGRAYDSAELVGDSGAAGKVELRFNRQLGSVALMPYAFYEGGWVSRRLSPVEFIAEEESALCAGGGFRITAGRFVTGYVEAAVPLNRTIAAEGNRDTRIFGGLRFSF